MDIVCFDMEGTLTPEIWEQVAADSGISELNKTTRDLPSYSDLMDYRIEIMKEHNLKLADIIKATEKLDLLDGALDFLNQVRQEFQVVILSDTFHEIAYPLMEKLGYPLLLCHTLDVDTEGNILGYKLRDPHVDLLIYSQEYCPQYQHQEYDKAKEGNQAFPLTDMQFHEKYQIELQLETLALPDLKNLEPHQASLIFQLP